VSDHLENSEFLCCTHFQLQVIFLIPHHSKYDTQMTQILLEEYIFITRHTNRTNEERILHGIRLAYIASSYRRFLISLLLLLLLL